MDLLTLEVLKAQDPWGRLLIYGPFPEDRLRNSRVSLSTAMQGVNIHVGCAYLMLEGRLRHNVDIYLDSLHVATHQHWPEGVFCHGCAHWVTDEVRYTKTSTPEDLWRSRR